MSRPLLFRIYVLTAIVIAITAVVWTFSVASWTTAETLLFYAALVAVVAWVRVDEDSPGFEAAVVFAAILVLHNPAVALICVFVGASAAHVVRDAGRRTFRLDSFYDAAQLALSYYIVAILYASAVAREAPLMAKVSGYILLVVGYLLAHVAFAAVRHALDERSGALDVRGVLVAQGRMLLLMTPVVAAEVLCYAVYGMPGFALAFLPVLIVAYAMRNETEATRQNTELVRRNRELSILTESASQILSAEGDQETLRRMVSLLGRLARLKACAIVTWGSNPDVPATIYRHGACQPDDQGILAWVESAGFAESAPSRAFVFHNDQRRFPLSEGNAIQILIGIQTAEVIYGILIYETEDPAILKSGSINLLTLLASQTALSLQDQLLRREMGEKTTQLEAQAATKSLILDVANGLIGSFDVDAMLTRIAQAISKALGFEKVVFALLDPKRAEFTRRAHMGLDDVWEEMKKKPVASTEITPFFADEFRVSNSFFVSHTALQQSEHGVFVRHDDDPLRRPDEWHENDILLVPLSSADEMLGYLAVRDPRDLRVPNLETVKTLEIFAVQAVTALQSARQYEEIRRLTFIDGLTSAFNHRYFQEALAKEVHRSARTGREFALAMLDIDNFKRINDTFGHPVGDEILKGLVDEMVTNARDTDVVARYGGEEFAIIFADTPASSARDAGNRMRELVAKRELNMPSVGRALRVTVSIGVAIYPHDGATTTDLVSRADTALYFAKKNGKNQVAMAGELPAESASA
ncbi:MAG TPA: sensor domain-containing diguanylate cyclase [Thermoanaerobaculia bacterium]|nr:sensor domain-containing diguanylate cyclase [Thermoanaerobaculia bacterium]